MAYTSASKICDLGFSYQNFDVADASEFNALVRNTLDEQITLITIDYPQYEQATATNKLILAEAEKYKTAAALKRMQASQAASDSARDFGAPIDSGENLYKVAQQFDTRGDIWLGKLGVAKSMVNEGAGIASSVVVSG